MTATSWTAGTVVCPTATLTPGTVHVDGDGRITDVRAGASPDASDLGGDVLLVPGAVDLHGDAIEKLAEPRPGVRMPFPVAARALDRRLAASGVTTAYSALSFAGDELGLREPAAAADLAAALRDLPDPSVRHLIHLRVELTHGPSVEAAAALLGRPGDVALVSVMNHTPGQGQFTTVAAYAAFHEKTYGTGGAALDLRVREKLAAASAAPKHLATVARAAANAGTPLAYHDPDSPAAVQRAHAAGARIAEFPTTEAAARAARKLGLTVLMGAPNLLRGSSSSGNLSAVQTLRYGLLDGLVSDYYPEAMWPAVIRAGLPLCDAAGLVADVPARAAGLTDRGRIEPGRRADLVAVRSDGTVVRTIVAGRVVA